MQFEKFGTDDLDYDDTKSVQENNSRAMFAMARRLHNIAVAVEGIGMNGAMRGIGPDQRGTLEKIAADVPEAIREVTRAVMVGKVSF
jgi:hypothetical protein